MSKQSISIFILLGAIIVLLFGWLGIQPVYLEEQRRAVVAMEMLFSGDYIIPTIFGELYFKKPPVWNWILVGAFKLFGDYSEFSLRFFAVLSFLGSALLIYLFTKKYISKAFAWAASLLYLISADIFLYFSITAEIDLFYSLLILAIILGSIHFYEQGNKWTLFLSIYLVGAIAFLTKGMPTLLFIPITLLTVFIYNRNFKGLVSLPHFSGIVLFSSILGAYFYAYSAKAPIGELISVLWDESSQRTASEMPANNLWVHLFLFPVEVIKNLLPASIFLILLFPPFKSRLKDRMSLMILLVLGFNILIYWLSPGTRQRYIYMLYPLFIILLVKLYESARHGEQNPDTLLKRIGIITGSLLAAAMIAYPFIPALDFMPNRLYTSIAGLLVLSMTFLFFLKYQKNILFLFIGLMITLRLFGNMSIVTYRGTAHNEIMPEIDAGREIGKRTSGQEVFILGNSDIPLRIAYYAYRERNAPFGKVHRVDPGSVVLTDSLQLSRQDKLMVLDTFYQTSGKPYFLAVRPKP